MMGGFGENFGSNFAGIVVIPSSSTKTVTADLCVATSTKNNLCVATSTKNNLCTTESIKEELCV